MKTILANVRRGMTWESAATLAGVNRRTVERWKARGRKQPAGAYGKFLDMCEQATQAFKSRHLAIVEGATKVRRKTRTVTKSHPGGKQTREVHVERILPDAGTSRWFLERRFPEEFGRQVVQHTGKVETGPTAPEDRTFRHVSVAPPRRNADGFPIPGCPTCNAETETKPDTGGYRRCLTCGTLFFGSAYEDAAAGDGGGTS